MLKVMINVDVIGGGIVAGTNIEWAEQVWNPVTGCTKVSAGCAHCYAERMSKRLAGRCGYLKDEPFKVRLHPEKLEEPLKWKKPRRIFVNSMSDLFHEDVDEKFTAEIFAIMDLARYHTFMILTKRPKRASDLLNNEDFQFHVGWFQSQAERGFNLPKSKEIGPWPFKNVWLGVSVENQVAADERIPLLLQTPAAVRFISAEPLLGSVNLSPWLGISQYEEGAAWARDTGADLDLVIVGGESGPSARPVHPDWVRSLRDQCRAAKVPFFFKQWGEWMPNGPVTSERRIARPGGYIFDKDVLRDKGDIILSRVGKKQAGRELDGRMWDEMPEGPKNGTT